MKEDECSKNKANEMSNDVLNHHDTLLTIMAGASLRVVDGLGLIIMLFTVVLNYTSMKGAWGPLMITITIIHAMRISIRNFTDFLLIRRGWRWTTLIGNSCRSRTPYPVRAIFFLSVMNSFLVLSIDSCDRADGCESQVLMYYIAVQQILYLPSIYYVFKGIIDPPWFMMMIMIALNSSIMVSSIRQYEGDDLELLAVPVYCQIVSSLLILALHSGRRFMMSKRKNHFSIFFCGGWWDIRLVMINELGEKEGMEYCREY